MFMSFPSLEKRPHALGSSPHFGGGSEDQAVDLDLMSRDDLAPVGAPTRVSTKSGMPMAGVWINRM